MITYANLQMENMQTEGFVSNLTGPLSLQIEAGKFTHYFKKREPDADGNNSFVTSSVIHEYPAIALDIVSDPELEVIYDIYLLMEMSPEGFNMHIDRTEISEGVFAAYTGQTPLLHTLLSIAVPPGTVDLAGIDMQIRNIGLLESSEFV